METKTRRKHERRETRDHVLLFRVGDLVVRAPVVNVSHGGVFARADVELERGTYLECVIESPHAPNEAFGAVVVHPSSERGGVALRFTRERVAALHASERVAAVHASQRVAALHRGERVAAVHAGERVAAVHVGERVAAVHASERVAAVHASARFAHASERVAAAHAGELPSRAADLRDSRELRSDRRVNHSVRAQMAALQREVKKLTAQNAALKEEVDAADAAYRLVGSLQQQVAELHNNRR